MGRPKWRSELERRAAFLQAIADHEEYAATRIMGIANLDKKYAKGWIELYEKRGYIIVERSGKPIHGTQKRTMFITSIGRQILLEYNNIRRKIMQ